MKNKWYVPYLFIMPWIVGFLVFFAFPLLLSMFMSLHDWGMYGKEKFVGFGNYIKILTNDPQFRASLKITIEYAMILVPINIIVGLVLALLLNKELKGNGFFKVSYYIPSVVAGVALAIIWKEILNLNGILNYFLSFFGVPKIDWLLNKKTALFSVVLTTLWSNGSIMLIFLGGLKGIDKSLYEASRIDGAKKYQSFCKITLPLLSPTILFNFIMAIIAAFQQLTVVMNLIGKGPSNSTYLYSLYVYNTAFGGSFKFGYAAALSWIMFLIILTLSGVVMWGSKKWTYYEV